MKSAYLFESFAARLREFIRYSAQPQELSGIKGGGTSSVPGQDVRAAAEDTFNRLALELFALQFEHNPVFRRFCVARNVSPGTVEQWSRVPAMPTPAFKELEVSCLPAEARTAVFYSSGTTGERPSRHFHSAASLGIYEASLLAWFRVCVLGDKLASGQPAQTGEAGRMQMICLTPTAAAAPHSSLVHMIETICREHGSGESASLGVVTNDGAWGLNLESALRVLREAASAQHPVVILGTAFSFVHLFDYLAGRNERFRLAAGSRAMETGGYKGRSRGLPKAELHGAITSRLGIPLANIVCEYGMSELSSQAYDREVGKGRAGGGNSNRRFHFPPWARVRIVSPETGVEVGEGETGLIQVVDLANVYSMMAIQTEDLGIRRDDGFDLVGRAALAEPRGCSLMTAP